MLTLKERVDRLDAAIQHKNMVRNRWRQGDAVCIMAALSPECEEVEHVSACPAELCPAWWASLSIELNDRGSDEYYWPMLKRYASLARQWDKMDEAKWEELLKRILCLFLDQLVGIPDLNSIKECVRSGEKGNHLNLSHLSLCKQSVLHDILQLEVLQAYLYLPTAVFKVMYVIEVKEEDLDEFYERLNMQILDEMEAVLTGQS